MKAKYRPIKALYNHLTIKRRLPRIFPDKSKLYPDDYFTSGRVVMPDKRIRLVASGCVLPFYDQFEMNGRVASHIISYGIDEEMHLSLFSHSVYPNFKLTPADIEGSYAHNFTAFTQITVNGNIADEKVRFVDILGKLTFVNSTDIGVEIKRTFFPAVFTTALIERIDVENLSEEDKNVEIRVPSGEYLSLPKYSVDGKEYLSRTDIADSDGRMMRGLDPYRKDTLHIGQTLTFYSVYYTRPKEEDLLVDCKFEEKKRDCLIKDVLQGIRIETGDLVLDAAFSHALIKGCESVFETKRGLMFSRGGGSAGTSMVIDDIEHSAPFIGYSGWDIPIQATLNTLRLFRDDLNLQEKPSKINKIAPLVTDQAKGVWITPKERGDTQMYASGLTRFLLALGDRTIGEEFLPTVDFCINHSKLNTDKNGLVKSISDDIWGREIKRINLSTNCATYDAYIKASFLSSALGRNQKKYEYFNLAAKQRNAVVRQLTTVWDGYKTYKSHSTDKKLRAEICLPMCVGIKDYSKSTYDVLFDTLYTDGAMQPELGHKGYRDRWLLLSLRGGFKIGRSDKTADYLKEYTLNRVIGTHAPYPHESFPEGNMRQLSSDSLLYARIFVEGVFGLSCIDFGRFSITPSVPSCWKKVALRHIVLADMPIDIIIENGKLSVLDQTGNVIKECNIINDQKVDINLYE